MLQSRTPHGPHRAVGVGDDLHLDVARPLDDALHEHRRITERLASLGTGALERLGEPGVGVDAPDAPPAAAGGRLDHQRVADRAGLGTRLVQRVDRARHSTARPGRRPARRAAWPRSCRRGGASPRRSGRRTRCPTGRTARRTPAARRRSPTRPTPRPQRRRSSARSSAARSRYGLPAPAGRSSSRHTASSASRTNIACRSARVCRAIVRRSSPRSTRSSRTALISRIAASPRLTIAIRPNPQVTTRMVDRNGL